MRRLLAVVLATALGAGGCGNGGGVSAGDLATVAGAIRELEQKGAAFSYTDTLVRSGGSNSPKGATSQVSLTGVGQGRDDVTAFKLTELDAAGKPVQAYDLVINDIYLFVRPHATSREWFFGAGSDFNYLYPAIRLNLLRETVLLASGSSKGSSFSNGGFYSQYTIQVAPDQLEQLLSMPLSPNQQAAFVKSGGGTISAYLTNSGHLQRLDLHASGMNPDTSIRRVVDSSMTISRVGKITDPSIPTSALSVQPVDMFSTGPAPNGP